MKKVTESDYKEACTRYEYLKDRRYTLREFELEQAKIEMKRAQQYYQHVSDQIQKCEDDMQRYSETIEAYTIENDLFPDSKRNEVYHKICDLNPSELEFVKTVVRAPGCKLRNVFSVLDEKGESYPLWKKPEDLGLIYHVGAYKWRPYKKTVLYFKSKKHV